MIDAYRERGLTPPDHILDPPDIRPEFYVFWEAFQDLQTERVVPRGTIPITPMITYANQYDLDPDQLKRIVWKVDRVLLDHWKNQDDRAQAKSDAERKAALQKTGVSS